MVEPGRRGEDIGVDQVTVWMVPLRRHGELRELKGSLTITSDSLVFTERKAGDEFLIPLGSIRKTRRVRGSPILMVHHGDGAERWETAFYFAQPPPLRPPEPSSLEPPRLLGLGLGSKSGAPTSPRRAKKRHMKSNVAYLQNASFDKKDLIQAWVNKIREATRP